jgi:hypothetical protein
MMQPNQVAGNQSPEAQQIRGTMSQMQRGQQEREQATRQTEAKISETEARALFGANRAEYAPEMSEAELAQKQANTGLTQARGKTARIQAQFEPAKQQAMLERLRADAANNKAGAKERYANVKRKLAEVDVLIGLTPEEAKAAQAERDAQEATSNAEPAPSNQPKQSAPQDEREATIRSLAEEAGISMDDTGNILNDVNTTTERLFRAKGMLANNMLNQWLGIVARLKPKN